jgi:two-component system OmpR family response regulator
MDFANAEPMPTILVADDDPHIREVISFALEKAGMQVHAVHDGAGAIAAFERVRPALIVLDVGMPGMDGLEVCRRIRRSSDVPILFLSARDEEIDRVLGLEMGGDDYVTKPFSPRELVARINVILRRGRKAEAAPAGPLARGRLSLDPARHEARFADRPLPLTAIEFAVLKTLLAAAGRVLSRDQIMQAAYPKNIHVSDRTIDSHVRNLRGKLKEAGCEDAVETVHGVGLRIGRCGG